MDAVDWREREVRHQQRADAFSATWRARQLSGDKHPVDDFLFTYYPVRPGVLRRWHPGAGVVLADGEVSTGSTRSEGSGSTRSEGSGSTGATRPDREHWAWYRREAGGLVIDAEGFVEKHGAIIRFIVSLLQATADRPAQLSCFGLHEWAMVYRGGARHDVALRLGQTATDAVVEQNRIACTHFDAYRFFTPAAVPLNLLQPTRENQPQFEQPGCLHAGMDVYKWATKLGPLIPGELLLDCFELARDIRELDMRAAPYDLAAWGYTPVPIETAEGRAEYARAQRDFAERGNVLRGQVIAAVQLATGQSA